MAWMILPERNSSNKTQCGLKQPNIGQPIHRNVFSRAQCSSPPISLLRLTIPDGSFTALVLFASLIQTMALHVLLRLLVAFTLSFSDTSGQRRSPTKTCHNGMVHADCIDFCPPSCQLPLACLPAFLDVSVPSIPGTIRSLTTALNMASARMEVRSSFEHCSKSSHWFLVVSRLRL